MVTTDSYAFRKHLYEGQRDDTAADPEFDLEYPICTPKSHCRARKSPEHCQVWPKKQNIYLMSLRYSAMVGHMLCMLEARGSISGVYLWMYYIYSGTDKLAVLPFRLQVHFTSSLMLVFWGPYSKMLPLFPFIPYVMSQNRVLSD